MNCLHCNKPIKGKRNTKRYCGNTCKQYAYLKRSFTLPSDMNSVSLNNSENTLTSKENNITLKPINTHGYKPQIIEQEYEYINPDILDAIQSASIFLDESSSYFTTTTNNGGRITPQNFSAFTYIVPRIRCIIENLFQLSYKRKLHFQTANAMCRALEEICLSDHIKQLPSDFPFFEDLLKLHEQFKPIADYLKENAEGIKFRLTKPAIVRYIIILKLIRDCAKREAFSKLFPELSKAKPV